MRPTRQKTISLRLRGPVLQKGRVGERVAGQGKGSRAGAKKQKEESVTSRLKQLYLSLILNKCRCTYDLFVQANPQQRRADSRPAPMPASEWLSMLDEAEGGSLVHQRCGNFDFATKEGINSMFWIEHQLTGSISGRARHMRRVHQPACGRVRAPQNL